MMWVKEAETWKGFINPTFFLLVIKKSDLDRICRSFLIGWLHGVPHGSVFASTPVSFSFMPNHLRSHFQSHSLWDINVIMLCYVIFLYLSTCCNKRAPMWVGRKAKANSYINCCAGIGGIIIEKIFSLCISNSQCLHKLWGVAMCRH